MNSFRRNAHYSKKAQMKIQQMAFVLVAIVLFFAMAAIFYLTIYTADLREKAEYLQEKEAIELVRAIAGTPEFSFSSEPCSGCIDLDKALIIAGEDDYEDFWNLDALWIERIYPKPNDRECTQANYPDCGQITIIKNSGELSSDASAFVILARYTEENTGYVKYEIGRIHAKTKS